MINETIRLTADWLGDATAGVNAMLAVLPRFAGDAAPTPVARVADEIRTELVGEGRFPDTFPCVVVELERASVTGNQVTTTTGDGSVTLLVRVGVQHVEAQQARRDGGYYLRAVYQSLLALARQDPNGTARSANAVQMVAFDDVEMMAASDTIGDTTVIAALRQTISVRDYGP